MIRRIFLSTAAVILAVATLSTAHAVVIKPGTYKLNWKIVKSSKDLDWFGMPRIASNPDFSMEKKLSGLGLTNPLIATAGRYLTILDRSQGTDKGYDTAYLLLNEQVVDKIDLKKAVKVHLRKDKNGYLSNLDKFTLVDLPFGEGKDRVTKRTPLYVVYNPDDVFNIAVLPLGNMSGTVKTDKGNLTVRIIDPFLDGIYGKKPDIDPETGEYMGTNVIIFGNKLIENLDAYDVKVPGTPVSYDGKLYTFKISNNGEYLIVKPYSDTVGKLKVDSLNGNRCKVPYTLGMINGACGMFTIKPNQTIDVPGGKYMCKTNVTYGKKPDQVEFRLEAAKKTEIVAGKETKVVIGGPISFVLDPAPATLKLKPGDKVTIKINLKAGEDKVEDTNRPITVKILDASGNQITEETLSIGSGWRQYNLQALQVPGQYTFVASIDSGPYQGLVESKQSFIVQQ